MELSRITRKFTESVIREMTRVANENPGTINLAQGYPDFAAPEVIKNAAIKAIKEDINQYAITWGSENLRHALAEKVSKYNGMDFVDPDKNITVTCGSTEAMISTLKAIINPGDEVIVFLPRYENYGPDCLLSGATPRYIKLRFPDYSFDFDELEDLFNDKTKAIIINTPNNPTGKVYNRREMEFIAELCLKYNSIAITDEIYEHILFDGREHISIASLPGMRDHSITINSISKTYSLTGWRVGWAIANESTTQEIKKVHDFLTVGAAAPLQEAAAFALSMADGYYEWLKYFYQDARSYLYESLKKTPLKPIKPYGAYYIMCDCKEFMNDNKIKSSVDLAMYLIKEVGIATVPGSSFYEDPNDGNYQTRFCFCKKKETLEEAGGKLEGIK